MSAVGPFNQAVYAALAGDAGLVAVLAIRPNTDDQPGIYSLKADEGAAYPYVILGTESEDDGGALGHVGFRNEMDIGIYSQRDISQPVSKQVVHTIYTHVHRILNGSELTAGGFRFAISRMRLLLVTLESDGRTVMAPATYRVQSWAI